MQETVYIRLRKKVMIQPRTREIAFHHLATFIGDDQTVARLHQLTVPISYPTKHAKTMMIDSFLLLGKILDMDKKLSVQFIGPTEVLIEQEREEKRFSIILLCAIWCTLFVGACLTMMNFHFDVNMQEVQTKIHYLLTGEKVTHPYAIQIPYAIGIGVGMLLFLNESFFPNKRNEPSPIDIEMYRYEQTRKNYLQKKEDEKKGHV